MKKEWKKPELTVLVRMRPEESILAACKVTGQPQVAPNTFNAVCNQDDGLGGCVQCSSLIGS